MLIDLQRRIAEAGRIRIGQQVASGKGRRPAKLDTFRLTSSDERRIRQAAEVYGGEAREWDAPAGPQWEVITERAELDVVVPPQDLSFSQSYELWSAGGCQRRCDGASESISGSACLCDPAARECEIHTRLSVLLADLPGLGVWRIDTQGWYAAQELAGAVQVIGMAAGTRLLPARLRLDQRMVKRGGQTRRFAVPVLDVELTPAALLTGGHGQELEQLETSERPKLTPVPAAPEGSGKTIAEQSEPPEPKPRRRNSAAPIPPSGRSRRATKTDEGDEQDALAESGVLEQNEAEKPKGRPRRKAKSEDEDPTAYWMARLHAAGNERGVDHDGLRLIAAALRKVPADELGDFSLTDLTPATLESVDKLVRSFEGDGEIDVDDATDWVEKIANAKGLASWDEIDPLATAAISGDLDAATPAAWIAFGLRLHAGEYDGEDE